MNQWLKCGSLKKYINKIKGDNTVNGVNEVHINNSKHLFIKILLVNPPLSA